MLGSSNSIACANIMLNTAVAESLRQYANRLENARHFEADLHDLIKETVTRHKRIIFNGNGYDDAWIAEATEVRGLLNLRTTPDAMPRLLDPKNVEMLTAHKVFSRSELESRYEIILENYCKSVNIEALTMIDMARKEILPAVEAYACDIAKTLNAKTAAVPGLSCRYERDLVSKLTELAEEIDSAITALEAEAIRYKTVTDVTEAAFMIRDVILQRMAELRVVCDEAETLTAENYWPFPTYEKLLFGVR